MNSQYPAAHIVAVPIVASIKIGFAGKTATIPPYEINNLLLNIMITPSNLTISKDTAQTTQIRVSLSSVFTFKF